MLTLYALGASPSDLESQYRNNKSYQRPPPPVDETIVENLHDHRKFHEYLGNEEYYRDFLMFFQTEIDKKGHEAVINEYCLKGDERANDMLVRLHAGESISLEYSTNTTLIRPQGFLHPMIHLGFGIEFNQPAIMAEALAQAAVHDNWIGTLLAFESFHQEKY